MEKKRPKSLNEWVMEKLLPSQSFREADLYAVFASLVIIAMLFPGSFEQYLGWASEMESTRSQLHILILVVGVAMSTLLSIIYALTPWVPSKKEARMMVYTACLVVAIAVVLALVEDAAYYYVHKSYVAIFLVFPVLGAIRAGWLLLKAKYGFPEDWFVYKNESILRILLVSLWICMAALAGKWIGLSAVMTYLFMLESTRIVPRLGQVNS